MLITWHSFEFLSQGIIHRKFQRQFLLISLPYLVALVIGLAEFALEKYFFAGWKTAVCKWLFWPGLIIVAAGAGIENDGYTARETFLYARNTS